MKGPLLALCLLVAPATTGVFAADASPAVAARQALPDSLPGRALGEWLDAFNSGELEPLQRFYAAHPQKDTPQDVLDWRLQTGGFDLVAVERDEPRRTVALVRDRLYTDERMRITATLDESGRTSVRANGLDTPRRTLQGALSGLQAELDRLAGTGEFSGQVLVARDGKPLLRVAHGLADRERSMPIDEDTRFNLASANKMFTAVAALQLVHAGKLSLDAPIGQVLTDYPNPQVAAAVTLRQLLSHRSGLAEMAFWDDKDMTPQAWASLRGELLSHRDYVARYGSRPPASAPGVHTQYNNFAFVVAGAMIERASGMDYYDYLQQHVFDPAGMTQTGFPLEATQPESHAIGYTRDGSSWKSNRDIAWRRGLAAGGAHSTVGDLLRFAQALQDGRLLAPAMLAEATRPQIPEGWYGLGFVVVGQGPLRRFGHGGDAPGINTDVRIFPEAGYVLVAFSNIDPPAAYRAFRWFEPRMPVERTPAPVAISR